MKELYRNTRQIIWNFLQRNFVDFKKDAVHDMFDFSY